MSDLPRPSSSAGPASTASLQPAPAGSAWIAGAAVVAATYVYFLLFAEFALLELVMPLSGGEAARARPVMLALGLGGILGSSGAAATFRLVRLRPTLAGALVACAAMALAAAFAQRWAIAAAVAFGVGIALAWLTVTLAAGLRAAVGIDRLGRAIGVGTGVAYAICNIPGVFTASAATQAWIAAAAVFAGMSAVPFLRPRPIVRAPSRDDAGAGAARWITVFLALVWLDSAAFYVIQHNEALRADTWTGSTRLWWNSMSHLLAGVLAGWALDRDALARVTGFGLACLALACGLLATGERPGGAVTLAYTAGVSAYSAALVYYPARSGRAWIAGLTYAIGGWLGSGLGIGMAENLQHIPMGFVLMAAAVGFGMLVWRWRAVAVAVAVSGWLAATHGADAAEPESLIARGREVYIAEGCIHCHSQFVRPGTVDVSRWGPASSPSDARAQRPPLFGNRRQGPDLAQVARRRSREWNRLHLIAPRLLMPGSRMPSYAHLFRPADSTADGEALVAYLASLGREGTSGFGAAAMDEASRQWRPSDPPVAPAEAQRLFSAWCASCHGSEGKGDGALARALSVPPPDFSREPWRRVPEGPATEAVLARIIKFGLPGSPMAGHEYLTDSQIAGLAQHVLALHVRRNPG